MMNTLSKTWLVLGAFGLALAVRADNLPVLTTGHTDVGVNFEDGAWDLHVHAEDLGMEYEPDAVWLKVSGTARTVVPSAPTFNFLGTAGDPVWILPAVQKAELLFLGLGTEELGAGVFSDDTVQVALKSVDGPGNFIVYQLDAFGVPVVSFNRGDGIGSNDVRTLTAGGHTHVNWAFTAPGKYRIGVQASGVLAATGETTTSEVAEYLFDVGELPRLFLAKQAGHDHLHLQWLSETNASYQIIYCLGAASGGWTNLGSPVAGTGGVMEEHVETLYPAQFFRLLVNYHPGSEPGVVAHLCIADAASAAGAQHSPAMPFTNAIRSFATDPVRGQVPELDASNLQIPRTLPLTGMPTKTSMHGVLETPSRP